MIEIRAPYGTTFTKDVIDPATGAVRGIRFDRGVARLADSDPAVAVFRGLPGKPYGAEYTVSTLAEGVAA